MTIKSTEHKDQEAFQNSDEFKEKANHAIRLRQRITNYYINERIRVRKTEGKGANSFKFERIGSFLIFKTLTN